MTARTYNLIVDQGADYTLTVPVLNGDSPVAVDGWAAVGQIRSHAGDDVVLYEFDLTPSSSNVILHIPAVDSTAWKFRSARYDVELTTPDGASRIRLIEGLVIIRPEITR